METDDRVAQVIDSIDDVISQLDTMDAKISSYKIQLNVSLLHACSSLVRPLLTAACASLLFALQAVSDDISYIESQNRGLQVQTSNQKALLGELENLLVRPLPFALSQQLRVDTVDPRSFLLAQTIVQVENEDLMTLTQESPGSDKGIVALEGAASSLYKALQATRETGTSWISTLGWVT